MAAVYAASHRNGQRAALKILHADFAREKTICERFLREAYVSNKVNHGATVQVLDDDMTETGEPFLIMELLEGETVRDAWKKSGRTMPIGPRPPDLRAASSTASRPATRSRSFTAISSPRTSSSLKKDDEIRVLDFGVAQMRDATSERTATGTALGTPAYMSPEQAMGLVDQLDGRADLFSVGAMMHALITGHRINNGRTEQEALVMAATKPVPSVARLAPHLPIELIKVIDKSLAWDRRNRFQDAREMQKALIDLMPAQGVGAARRRARRRVRTRSSRPAAARSCRRSRAAAAHRQQPPQRAGAGAALKASSRGHAAIGATCAALSLRRPADGRRSTAAPHRPAAARARVDASRSSRAYDPMRRLPAARSDAGDAASVQLQAAGSARPRTRSSTPIRACRRCAT